MKRQGRREPGAGAVAAPRRTRSKEAIVNKFTMLSRTSSRRPATAGTKPADPKDPDNNAKNRRVEIKVYPAEAAVTARGNLGARRPAHVRADALPACRRGGAGSAEPSAAMRLALGVGMIALVLFAVVARHARRGAGGSARSRRSKLPAPGEVFGSFASSGERALLASIAATLQRVLIGFGLAALVGVPLGIARGREPRRRERARAARALPAQPAGRRADSADDPLVRHRRNAEGDVHLHRHACRSCTRDAVKAVSSVPERYVETAQTLGARARQIVRKVLVPLALPDIYHQPAASRSGCVRLHHARRADQRAARPRRADHEQPAPRAVRAHLF